MGSSRKAATTPNPKKIRTADDMIASIKNSKAKANPIPVDDDTDEEEQVEVEALNLDQETEEAFTASVWQSVRALKPAIDIARDNNLPFAVWHGSFVDEYGPIDSIQGIGNKETGQAKKPKSNPGKQLVREAQDSITQTPNKVRDARASTGTVTPNTQRKKRKLDTEGQDEDSEASVVRHVSGNVVAVKVTKKG